MAENIHTLAARANQVVDAAGFVSCSVHSESERELAYRFDNHINAHAFQGQRQSLGMSARILVEDQRTVIVRH